LARSKLFRFDQNTQADNVLEVGKPLYEHIKGNWHSIYFKNSNPLVIELACGRGEYTTGLAAAYPDKNFVGIDIKGDRLWKGSQVAIENNLQNVAFLRTKIEELEKFFAKGEVAEIWIIHPDPRPRLRDARRRLTSPRFLGVYSRVLQPFGTIRLKTDSSLLFDYSLELFDSEEVKPYIRNLVYTKDLYQSPLLAEHHQIQTKYEKAAVSKNISIKYLRFKFDTTFVAGKETT
jgi:tRNA (guanine-N7-)-methyltransferase